MSPPISVVVAARNYGRYVPEALGSLRAQTFPDFEAVVIDDGSTDDTPEAVRPFLADPRFRYFRTEGLGQPRAKNLGLRLSSGPLVAYLDADDRWLPAKLEKQFRLFRDNPRLGVAYCRRNLIRPDGQPMPYEQPKLPRGPVLDRMVRDNFVCFSSAMVRREVLEHVGCFDPRLDLAIDFDLWLRVAPHYEFDFVDEVLVEYRTGHANLSRRLGDRLTSVLSTMRRCLKRRRVEEQVPRAVLRSAWGSTFRSLGFVHRPAEPAKALKCYLRALRADGRLLASARAAVATVVEWMRWRLGSARGRVEAHSENASVNV